MPEASTRAERAEALAYAQTTPFVLGEAPLEYGEQDPLNVYGDIHGYAGHAIASSVGAGPTRLIILSASEMAPGSVDRIMADACMSPVLCEPEATVDIVPYSLRELRSVIGWVARSPMGFEAAAMTPIEQEPNASSYRTLVEFETTADALPILREMLETGGVPEDAYRVKVGRPYNSI